MAIGLRCLRCGQDNLPPEANVCPRCNSHLGMQYQHVLREGATLFSPRSNYRVESVLGQGGFGITYRAYDVTGSRHVAIKEYFVKELNHRDTTSGAVGVSTMDADQFRRGLSRFQREGQMLLELQSRGGSPHLVRVLDTFEANATAYLVMELLEGHPLREEMVLRARTPDGHDLYHPLPEQRVWQVADALVKALSVAHAAGIYHLDLKPNNCMVETVVGSAGTTNRIVLIDFGAARRATGGTPTIMAFTPLYCPLEVEAGEGIGPESDLFELGMMLHELLTGELPPPAKMRWAGQAQGRPDWNTQHLKEPWRSLIASATQLAKEDRPGDVAEWWQRQGRIPSPRAAGADRPISNVPLPDTSFPSPAPLRAVSTLTAGEARAGGSFVVHTEDGRTIPVRHPAGLRDGAEFPAPGLGRLGAFGTPPGDLLVTVSVTPGPLDKLKSLPKIALMALTLAVLSGAGLLAALFLKLSAR